MAEKKMTMVEQYNATIALLNGETVEDYSVADAVAFLTGRAEQTAKKNAGNSERKLTPKEKAKMDEDAISMELITAVLRNANAPMPIGDINKANAELAELSNQKLTSLLTAMRKNGVVIRTEVKGKPNYALAPTEN